jgi:hypothetical protein
MLVNKIIKVVSFIVFVFFAACCKKNNATLDVNKIILKYHLDLENGFYNLEGTSWKRNGKIYANKAIDSSLIILINKKGDTILTSFNKGIEQWYASKTMKIDNEYFVIKRDYKYVELDSTKSDYMPRQETQGYYLYDEIDNQTNSYYRLDSVNRKLDPIKLISKAEILKKIKEKFHFKEKVSILASSNKYTFIAKDTLKGSQVYYQINTDYVPYKKDGVWVLEPKFHKGLANVYKMGLYNNNVKLSKEDLGYTLFQIANDTIGRKEYKYHIYLKFYSKFSCEIGKYKRCEDEFVKVEVILQDTTKNEERIIETFTDYSFFENHNFNMFKYKNGDYFMGALPEIEYRESIFRLDTINWKLDKVKRFNRKSDLNYTRYKRDKGSLISGDVRGEMSTFLQKYEIVKVKDGYRLITN